MKELKDRKLFYTLLCILFAALIAFIFGSVYDYEIALAIRKAFPSTDKTCVNAPAFAVICTCGIIPTTFFSAFAGTALITSKQNSKFWTWLWRVLGAIGYIVVAYITYDSATETAKIYSLTADNKTLFTVIIAVIVVLVNIGTSIITLKVTKNVNKDRLFWVAFSVFALIGIYFACGEIIKYSVSRPRPRTIFSMGTKETFRGWWEARFLYAFSLETPGDCKSFISGHTANTSCYIFLIPMIVSLFKVGEKKWATVIGALIGFAYSALIGVSRLYAQAHYLTDISGAVIMSVLIEILIYTIMPMIQIAIEKRIKKGN